MREDVTAFARLLCSPAARWLPGGIILRVFCCPELPQAICLTSRGYIIDGVQPNSRIKLCHPTFGGLVGIGRPASRLN